MEGRSCTWRAQFTCNEFEVSSLNRHKAHVLAIYGFGDRFGIEEVVLVRLQERFDELRWNQSRVMPLLAQCSRQEMRSRAGLKPD